MTARIDHLVYAVPDLEAAMDDLEQRLGIRAQYGGKHLAFGTHNALLGLGVDTYLEIMAPDFDQPPPQMSRPFDVDGLTAPRLAGWAIACDDIDTAVARSRDRGFDPGDPVEGRRVGPGGRVVRWRLTLNVLDGGPVPFLIDWGDSDHPSRTAPTGLSLVGLSIEHPDPPSLESTLAALGAWVEIRRAPQISLIARISGPTGVQELR